MVDQAVHTPTPTQDSTPAITRLDPTHSRVFQWIEYDPSAEAIIDIATGRPIRPQAPVLRVRYRSNGAVWEFWPVSEQEAREVMYPGQRYGFSIGSAFGQVVKAHKSGRQVEAGTGVGKVAREQGVDRQAEKQPAKQPARKGLWI